ncbi:MAG: DUF2157 domain-containing protein [bacterium]|nr:DUF2157 domain-containing protein [bacterium]
MTKEELLQELSVKINSGEIKREELVSRLNISYTEPVSSAESVSSVGTNVKTTSNFSVNKMLYALGGAIVIIGIIIFVSQIWDEVGSFGRIIVTLGLGLVIALCGSILLRSKPEDIIGSVFHIIAGLLIPGGAMVTLYELNIGQDSLWPVTLTFGFIFLFYLLLNFVHKNAVLTFFSIANGTAFVYLVVESIIDGPFYNHGELYAYLTMVVGLSYLLLAYAFREGWNNKLVGIIYFVGITSFLGAAFSRVFDSEIWQALFFLIVIGGLFLAVYMKNRSVLVMSTLFLIIHVSYITSKYFANSVGWPVALVILGFIFIGLGYASITINKKYISTNS